MRNDITIIIHIPLRRGQGGYQWERSPTPPQKKKNTYNLTDIHEHRYMYARTHTTEETLSKVSAKQYLFIKCCCLLMHLFPALPALTPRPPCFSPLRLLFSDPSPSALTKGMQETHLELIRDKEGGKTNWGMESRRREK